MADAAALEAALKAREREIECLRLARQGLTYEEIAKIVGYSDESGPRKAVQRALNRRVDAEVDLFRLSEEQKYDELEAILWEIARGEHAAVSFGKVAKLENGQLVLDRTVNIRAASALIALFERHSRLRGGDAPLKKVIYDLNNDVVQAEIKRINAMADELEAKEAARERERGERTEAYRQAEAIESDLR